MQRHDVQVLLGAHHVLAACAGGTIGKSLCGVKIDLAIRNQIIKSPLPVDFEVGHTVNDGFATERGHRERSRLSSYLPAPPDFSPLTGPARLLKKSGRRQFVVLVVLSENVSVSVVLWDAVAWCPIQLVTIGSPSGTVTWRSHGSLARTR